MKNERVIKREINGIIYVFKLVRLTTLLFDGPYKSYKWIFGEEDDPCHQVRRTANGVRKTLSFYLNISKKG